MRESCARQFFCSRGRLMGYVIRARRRRLGDVNAGSGSMQQSAPYLPPNPSGSMNVWAAINPFDSTSLWYDNPRAGVQVDSSWWDLIVNRTGQVSDSQAAQIRAQVTAAMLKAGAIPEQANVAGDQAAINAKTAAPGPAVGGTALFPPGSMADSIAANIGWWLLGGAAVLSVVAMRKR